jgi:hypothetical protein
MSDAANSAQISKYPQPIFVLGMAPRTGTHFLANLLCLHPECEAGAMAEDSLLTEAQLLVKYSRNMLNQWARVDGEPKPELAELLQESIGQGLISFLYSARRKKRESQLEKLGLEIDSNQPLKRLVTKTPSIMNIRLFFKLFPQAKLLILVRDGRAVVESSIRSFGDDPERLIRTWAREAERLLRFNHSEAFPKDQYMIVKYEELHIETEKQMRRILSFLGLDVDQYDFRSALNLPVVGSSTFKRTEQKVKWLPVMKTADFNPLERADDWPRSMHERFNWLAGNQLEQLGYARKSFVGNNLLWTCRNRIKDAVWTLRSKLTKSNKPTQNTD